ncbi:neuropeptides capa receptor-like [Amphiura filiformis]|uniref:neuropeptides capa receptor-like n=1 Tax=Amphiura filiformis TaxID=82378 RepID=UPI003B214722
MVMPCILVLGLCSNVAFIFVIYRIQWMRTIPNTYLLNLAIADTLFLIVAVGEKLFRFGSSPYHDDWAPVGTTGCILVPAIMSCCYYTSITLVSLVSLERFDAICRPLKHRQFSSKNRVLKLVAGAWTFSMLMASAQIPDYSHLVLYCALPPNNTGDLTVMKNHHPQVIGMCKPVAAWLDPFVNCVQTVPFIIAMFGNAFLYGRIVLAVKKSTAEAQMNGLSGQNLRNRNRVTRMLVINGVLFFLCLSPFELTSFLFVVWELSAGSLDMLITPSMMVWIQIARILMYFNSAINPVVYNITNPRYRTASRQAFCLKSVGSSHHTEYTQPTATHVAKTAVTAS